MQTFDVKCALFVLQLVQVRRRRVGRGRRRPAASAMRTGCCWRDWTPACSAPCTPAASSPCTNVGGEDWTRGRQPWGAGSRRFSTTSFTDKYKWVHHILYNSQFFLFFDETEGRLHKATRRTLASSRLHNFYLAYKFDSFNLEYQTAMIEISSN